MRSLRAGGGVRYTRLLVATGARVEFTTGERRLIIRRAPGHPPTSTSLEV